MTSDAAGGVSSPPLWVWYLVGTLVYLSFGFTELAGSDTWWHIAAGREMVQQGTIWATDPWSYTASDQTWHNHEWLSDLIFYGWVSLFGVYSLVIWKWLLVVTTFCLFLRVLIRASGSAPAALLATIIAIAIAAPFFDVRPHLYSLLGFSVLLNLTLERQARLRELLPLFLVWVNLHGGFIFGLMLLPFLLIPWKDFSFEGFRRAFLTGLACLLVCLVNPDGIRVFVMPLTYALDADSPFRGIAEWHNPFRAGGIVSPAYPYSLVVGAAVVMTWVLPTVRRQVPISLPALGIALLTVAMSLTSRRFITLWGLALALLMAPFLAALFRARFVSALSVPLLIVTTAWALVRIDGYSLRPVVAHHFLTADYLYPHDLMDVVMLNDIRGNTFAYYNWGGFLHWRGDGVLKVYIDGRANTLYDDQTYRNYVHVLKGRPGWISIVEDSGAEFFLWPHKGRHGRLIKELSGTGRWKTVYVGVRGTLLARKNVAIAAPLTLKDGGFHQDLSIAFVSHRLGKQELALSHGRRAHEARPWHIDGCRWLKTILTANDQRREAIAVMDECRAWFASPYLR